MSCYCYDCDSSHCRCHQEELEAKVKELESQVARLKNLRVGQEEAHRMEFDDARNIFQQLKTALTKEKALLLAEKNLSDSLGEALEGCLEYAEFDGSKHNIWRKPLSKLKEARK